MEKRNMWIGNIIGASIFLVPVITSIVIAWSSLTNKLASVLNPMLAFCIVGLICIVIYGIVGIGKLGILNEGRKGVSLFFLLYFEILRLVILGMGSFAFAIIIGFRLWRELDPAIFLRNLLLLTFFMLIVICVMLHYIVSFRCKDKSFYKKYVESRKNLLLSSDYDGILTVILGVVTVVLLIITMEESLINFDSKPNIKELISEKNAKSIFNYIIPTISIYLLPIKKMLILGIFKDKNYQ